MTIHNQAGDMGPSAEAEREPVKAFHAGANTNPVAGISAAPTSNPTTPEPPAVTTHSANLASGKLWAAISAAW